MSVLGPEPQTTYVFSEPPYPTPQSTSSLPEEEKSKQKDADEKYALAETFKKALTPQQLAAQQKEKLKAKMSLLENLLSNMIAKQDSDFKDYKIAKNDNQLTLKRDDPKSEIKFDLDKNGHASISGFPQEDVDKAAGEYAKNNPGARLTLNSPSQSQAEESIKRFLDAGGSPHQLVGLNIGGRPRPDILEKILEKYDPDIKKSAGYR